MLFLGLGTGLGTAMIVNGIVEPMELAHLPYRRATFEDYVGRRGLERLGRKKWRRHVHEVIELLRAALLPDEIVIGGGNAAKARDLPAGCRRGDNANAFVGGFRLWAAKRTGEARARRPANARAPRPKRDTREEGAKMSDAETPTDGAQGMAAPRCAPAAAQGTLAAGALRRRSGARRRS